MLLVGSLINLVSSIIAGYFMDRVTRIWRYVLFFIFCELASITLFFKTSKHMEGAALQVGQRGSLWQDVGFVSTICFTTQNYVWDTLLFYRAISKVKESYGSLKGLYCVISTTGVIMVDQWGGTLSVASPAAPFLLCAAVYGLQGALTIVLGLFNLLKI